MLIRLQDYSYRFAREVLNSKLHLKDEIESILKCPVDITKLSRPGYNAYLAEKFCEFGWESQPMASKKDSDISPKMDFFKQGIGIEVAFGRSSFIGLDFLKFEIAANEENIDLGVYITATKNFQKIAKRSTDLSGEILSVTKRW